MADRGFGGYGFNPDILLSHPPPNSTDLGHFHQPPVTVSLGGYYWVHSNAYSGVPPTAVHGGSDQDGTQIYVGRACHEGDYIPAKVMPDKNAAYISYGGLEHFKSEYEVLCEQKFEWQHSSGGNIPPNSVAGGKTSQGETLFIGRCFHEGANTVGKVQPSHGCLYIPFGGEELKFDSYEILVRL